MYTVNSFFCGGGGFDLGFINAGFEVVGAWDFDKYAVQSYAHNIDTLVKEADVSTMSWRDLRPASVWLFGFPCQDISIAGLKAGMIKGETRSGLFYEIMRLLQEVRTATPGSLPEIILAENVKAVKKYLPTIEEEYAKVGYKMYYVLYNSKYQGLAQNRERYFILGVREDIKQTFVFEEQQTEFVPKLKDFLEDHADEKFYVEDIKALHIIEKAEEGLRVKQATKKGYDVAVEGDMINVTRPNSKTRRGRIGKQIAQTLLTGHEQVVVESLPTINVLGMLDINGHDNIRRVYDVDGLSPTLNTGGGGNRQPKILDYDRLKVRKLTPREFARLQGFPESYQQVVSNVQFYKQMGNAVSVPVAEFVAGQIKQYLEYLEMCSN
ncbi:DNA cytosine methyltransferase [Priestia megaterium]|uniref:DNA cytosine methyltransferase n=1 Tax=Priestia megaterium TaxID=1404 RepID=UPI00285D409D|nr:DNA (cytosine-5-)-methyltransferase [Priestia megaterium]MDR7207580.1 DNA (cytosine-5)-methyltransferase 1 [Priestia megaterium]